jgi:hypothetical protein
MTDISYDKLGDAMEFVSKQQKELDEKAAIWFREFEKNFGLKPNQQMTAYETLKLMHRIYGEPNK